VTPPQPPASWRSPLALAVIYLGSLTYPLVYLSYTAALPTVAVWTPVVALLAGWRAPRAVSAAVAAVLLAANPAVLVVGRAVMLLMATSASLLPSAGGYPPPVACACVAGTPTVAAVAAFQWLHVSSGGAHFPVLLFVWLPVHALAAWVAAHKAAGMA
jgi:hypothetical protein